MKNTETKNRRRFRFNIIDVIILLVILAAAGGILIRSNIGEKIGIDSQSETVEIRFLVTYLDHSAGDAFVEGDILYFNANGQKIGTLSATKTIVPAEVFVTKSDGTIVKTESPGARKIDLRSGIIASGIYNSDGNFMLDGNTCLTPGMELSFHSEHIIVTAQITEIVRTGN